ncbi:MAG: HDIG domain-containing protein [Candidatus Promineifilaceae bacterium]|nr:HDIG domain-containing protein [Candidatus Promineifilaceae bacterium]
MSASDVREPVIARLQQLPEEWLLWLFALFLTLGLTLILSFNLVSSSQVTVTVGEPAGQDVRAPVSISYYSEVLTAQAQEQAQANVANVYTTPDLTVAREQITRARGIFNFIDVVRADTLATPEIRFNYLMAIEGLDLEPEIATLVLDMTPAEYAAVRDDIVRIIGEVMRREIREEPAALSEARRAARNEFSFNLSPAQERVVTSLVTQFIVPNTQFDLAATEQRRAEAVAAVEPVFREYVQGQPVVRVGEQVTPEHLEALEQMGLLRQEISWWQMARIFIASTLATSMITFYWRRFHNPLQGTPRYLLLLGALFLLFVLGGKLLVPGRGQFAYLFPAAAIGMLLAVIYDTRLAIFTGIILAFLVGFVAQESLEITIYLAVGPLFAALALRDAQRINAFFRAGLLAAVAHMIVILAFRLTENVETVEMLQLLLFAVLNGLISASITLAGFFIIGSLFGMMTTLQLQELSRLDHPLLRDLLRRAPGTYHHSIMVANLAEQAAERIEANSALVRVGAFYHDIGKMNRPPFFTENQEGINPHETLDPFISARIIISHVEDGLKLAQQHRLPDRIQDFIAEHHGDRLVYVFYKKAQEQAADDAKIDEDRFRYSGPRPRSRESAIVLLADSVEAASTAIRPNTGEEIERLVNKIVEDHLKDGQLDESGLTLGDLRAVRASFIDTLKGRFHVRVRYPEDEAIAAPPAPDGYPVTPQDAPVPSGAPTLSSPILQQAPRGDGG